MRGMCLGPSAVCINFSLAVVIKPAWCSGFFISSYLSSQLRLRLPASEGRTSGIALAEPWWREGDTRRQPNPATFRWLYATILINPGWAEVGSPFDWLGPYASQSRSPSTGTGIGSPSDRAACRRRPIHRTGGRVAGPDCTRRTSEITRIGDQ
jgi:hypothetical protein